MCNVLHRDQIAGLPESVFQAADRRGNRVCIARRCALLDIKAWCSVRLKVLGGLEILDGHKWLDDLEVVDRPQGT